MDEYSRKNMNSFSLFIYAHMLFSAVTDADFLDTEESKCLSNYEPSSQQLSMWRALGLL